jgi:hypothetical protein
MMKYTLLTKRGIIMQFYVESVALLYQSLYGGVIMTDAVVNVKLDKEIVI